MTVCASGFLQYSDVIEAIISTEGRKSIIPGMSFEDIAQEIRLECLRVLDAYNPKRIGPSPYKYLITCIKNFLYNIKRGIYVPNNPPCTRCPLWDKKKRSCLIDEIGCERITKYKNGMSKKAAIKMPNLLETEIVDVSQDVSAFMLDESIKSLLTPRLLKAYEKLKSGKKISQKAHNEIKEITKRLCQDE